jgi:hypothetical protein
MLPNIRPITNIRRKAVKLAKNVNLYQEKYDFLGGLQSQVTFDGQDFWAIDTYMHKTWAIETYLHKTLIMSTKSLLSRENIARK